MPSPSNRRLVFFRTAAALIGLLLAAAVAEAGLRVFLPRRMLSASNERKEFCRFDNLLGWAPRENIAARHERSGFSVVVEQNRFGLRGPADMRAERTNGGRRVLVLGDSYVWGFGVNQSELFSAQSVHQTSDEFINGGVSGYGTDQELLFYRQRGASFAVDEVVLALTPYNDVENNLAAEQYGHPKPYFTLTDGLTLHTAHVQPPREGWIGRVRRSSRVLNLCEEGGRTVGNFFARVKGPGGAAAARDAQLTIADVSARDRAGVDLTVAILQRLRDEVQASGAAFSVIFIPYKPHVLAGATNNHPLVPLIAQGLARAGVRYREPYTEFLKADRSGARVFNDLDNHFSPAGHALFARFLARSEFADAALNTYGTTPP